MDRDVKQNIAENAPIENPPEGGAGRDPLQDLSPEACTFEGRERCFRRHFAARAE